MIVHETTWIFMFTMDKYENLFYSILHSWKHCQSYGKKHYGIQISSQRSKWKCFINCLLIHGLILTVKPRKISKFQGINFACTHQWYDPSIRCRYLPVVLVIFKILNYHAILLMPLCNNIMRFITEMHYG